MRAINDKSELYITDFTNPEDGKRYLNFSPIEKRSPMATHEYNLSYCVDDQKWEGDVIEYGGWYDLEHEDVTALVAEFDLMDVVFEQPGIKEGYVIEITEEEALDLEGSGQPVFRDEAQKEGYYRGECPPDDYVDFEPVGRFVWQDANGYWAAMDNSEGKGINMDGFDTREEAILFARTGVDPASQVKGVEGIAQNARDGEDQQGVGVVDFTERDDR